MVKHTLNILQQMFQDFLRVFDCFLDFKLTEFKALVSSYFLTYLKHNFRDKVYHLQNR